MSPMRRIAESLVNAEPSRGAAKGRMRLFARGFAQCLARGLCCVALCCALMLCSACSAAPGGKGDVSGGNGAGSSGGASASVDASVGEGVGSGADGSADTDAGSSAYAAADDIGANLVNPQQQPDSSFIYDTLISDLAQADAYLDIQTVQVTGEVVGDNIAADVSGDNRWITLQALDGSYAQVAVYMTKESAERIDTFGRYAQRGTTLQVRGVFNLACKEHQGLSDLHANHVSVVEKGKVSPDELDTNAFIPGAVLVVVGALLSLLFHRMRERRR